MVINPLETRKFGIDRMPRLGEPQGSRLQPAISALPVQGDDQVATSDQKLELAARQLVSTTFFGTLLKQMHNSPFKSEIFSGGRGEQAFSPLMDEHLIQRISRGSGDKLVRQIVKQFHKSAAEAEEKRKSKDPLEAYRKQQEGGHVRTNRRA